MDPSTKEKIAPHFVADCVDLCHYLADAVAKDKFGDSEPRLYVNLAVDAKKDVKRTHNNVKKAQKSVTTAENKLKTAVRKSGESVTKAVAKATEARDKAKNALINAESAAKQAGEKLKDVTERAAESIEIQSAVIQCWVKELAKAASPNIPDCVQIYRIMPPLDSKPNDQHRRTCTFVYIIRTGYSGSDIVR